MFLKWNNAFGKAVAASVAAYMATTSLYAIPRGPCDEKPVVDCGCPEPAPGPFAFAYPFDRDLNCPNDIYFYADFLAMQAKQDGLEFALANSSPLGSALTDGTLGAFSSDHRDWKYNYGARFGVGFYTDHDAWQLDVDWTWFNIRDYKKFGASTGDGYLLPLWEPPSTSDDVFGSRSSALWKCNYNIIDGRLGKPYYISRYLVLNPHFGLRGGWINQHFSVDYSGATTPDFSNRAIHHGRNDFWGIGLRTGLCADWLIGHGVSIFGNAAGSLLFGKFKINQSLAIPDHLDSSFNLSDRHYMNVPNGEIAMGVAWGQRFSEDKYYLSLKAGYEFHVWFDQMNMRRFFKRTSSFSNDVVSRGNLTLNGFSFRVSVDL